MAKEQLKPKLVEAIDLPNGLKLEFWDESRPVAGDRWYVGLRALVPIPMAQTSERWEKTILLLKEALGKEACYQHLMERHFISCEKVPSVLGEMRQSFLANSLGYLSHPEFAKRFLVSKARELEKRRAWGSEYAEKIIQELRRPKGLEKTVN